MKHRLRGDILCLSKEFYNIFVIIFKLYKKKMKYFEATVLSVEYLFARLYPLNWSNLYLLYPFSKLSFKVVIINTDLVPAVTFNSTLQMQKSCLLFCCHYYLVKKSGQWPLSCHCNKCVSKRVWVFVLTSHTWEREQENRECLWYCSWQQSWIYWSRTRTATLSF